MKKIGPEGMTNQDTMARYVDNQASSYITWDALLERCQPEAKRRGASYLTSISELKKHFKHRRDHNGWDVEWDDDGVRIIRRR